MINDMTALDTETMNDLGLVQPDASKETENPEPKNDEVEVVIAEPVTNTEQKDDEDKSGTVPQTTPTPDTTTTVPVEYEIEGLGKVTSEQIKEWQKGNLRQSDYTKKTQELAREKEETKEALEVFQYLRNNPHLVEQLKQADTQGTVDTKLLETSNPEHAMLKQLYFKQMNMEIDTQLAHIKDKYKTDIDEVALFNKATELNTNDLESVFKMISYDAIKTNEQALIDRAKEELKKELESNKNATTTIVNKAGQTVQPRQVTLTPEEKRVAEGMGVSLADYAKWRDK